MSRTRKIPKGSGMFRHPRGRKQARRDGARPKAIPPSPWSDIHPDGQTRLPYKVAYGLHRKGRTRQEILEHLTRKFNFSVKESEDYLPPIGRRWYACNCQDCLKRRL